MIATMALMARARIANPAQLALVFGDGRLAVPVLIPEPPPEPTVPELLAACVANIEKISAWYKRHHGHILREYARVAECESCGSKLVVTDGEEE